MVEDYSLEAAPANQQRREQYAMSDEWTADFLSRAQVGHLATHWDAQPFITPLLFWYDPDRAAIYYHSGLSGRLRANIERHPQVCFEACNAGGLLPSNVAHGFSLQYESAVVFGKLRIVDGQAEQEHALYGMLRKYFPDHQPGKDYRPITAEELQRTGVYAIEIESWSGKRNWKEQVEPSPDWPVPPAG